MQLNPPPKVRVVLYVVSAIGSVVVSYLSMKHFLGSPEVSLWSGLVAVVSVMAGFNVSPQDK